MSQALLQIPAAPSGLDMRVQINQIVTALLTQNSGPTAPSVTYPGMWWGDTTANRLKRRSNDDTAWLNIGPLDDFLLDLRNAITANASAASAAAVAAANAQTTANSKMPNSGAAVVSALGYTPVNPGAVTTITAGAGGDVGANMLFARAPNGSLAADVRMDQYSSFLRFYEGGGASRGFSIDLAACEASANSRLALTSDLPAAFGTSPSDVTSTRALGQQFVNSTSKWRIVRVSLNNPGTTGQYAAGYVNNQQEASLWLYTSGTPGTLTLLVPPGAPYQVNITANIYMTKWVEYF